MADEVYLDIDFNPDAVARSKVSGKIAPSLPMTKFTVGGASELRPSYDFGEASKMDAASMFDFTDTGLTPLQQIYIIGYAVRGTRKGGCEAAGIPYRAVDKWMENENFVKTLQHAVDISRDCLEEELIRRAMDGSDRLLLEAVKAARPEKYNKKQSDVNIHGTLVHSWADLAKQAAIPVECTDAEEDDE